MPGTTSSRPTRRTPRCRRPRRAGGRAGRASCRSRPARVELEREHDRDRAVQPAGVALVAPAQPVDLVLQRGGCLSRRALARGCAGRRRPPAEARRVRSAAGRRSSARHGRRRRPTRDARARRAEARGEQIAQGAARRRPANSGRPAARSDRCGAPSASPRSAGLDVATRKGLGPVRRAARERERARRGAVGLGGDVSGASCCVRAIAVAHGTPASAAVRTATTRGASASA